MAGTLRGLADCKNSTLNAGTNCQEVFKNWFDFMETLVTAGVVTRIALYWGSAGTGTDFHDGTNPFGPNAFVLYKWPSNGGRAADVYQLGRWTDNTALASPGRIRNVTSWTGGAMGFAWTAAFEAGDVTPANPWSGSTNNDGTDTLGTPVWAAPVGGSMAHWPSSNGPGYGHQTNKENMVGMFAPLSSSNTLASRYSFWADDDSFFWLFDYGDVLGSEWGFFGRYTQRPGMIANPYNITHLSEDGDITATQTYGTSGGNQLREGGIYNPRTFKTEGCRYTFNDNVINAASQPSEMLTPTEFDELSILTTFVSGSLTKGACGVLEHLAAMYGVVDQDYANDLSRIVVSDPTIVLGAVSLPWNGLYTPRSTSNKGGTPF